MSQPIVEPAKLLKSSNAFVNSKSIQEHHKLQHKFLIFECLGLKTASLQKLSIEF